MTMGEKIQHLTKPLLLSVFTVFSPKQGKEARQINVTELEVMSAGTQRGICGECQIRNFRNVLKNYSKLDGGDSRRTRSKCSS